MKKILSMILVAAMLLCTLLLSSCDLMAQIMDNIIPQPDIPEINLGEPTRNTITKDEWIANMNGSNFTYTQKQTNQGNTVTIIAKMTETAGEVIGSDSDNPFYWVLLDGKTYMIEKDEQTNGWVASFVQDGWFSLGKQLQMRDDFFEQYFQYNEETRSYIFQTETGCTEFYFENGKLIKGTITNTDLSSSITIENAGTTTVTLPEYTVYQPKTTVTKEEFIAGFNPENFTFSFLVETSDPSGEVFDLNMCSVLVDSYTKSYEYRVDGVATQYGIIIDESTYTIFKNEETGIWECLKESDPVDWDTELTVQGLWYLDDVGGLFDDLTYREETESYFFEEDGYSIEIWYKDNQLERIELYAGDELRMCVENVGTTVVSIPDYVMAEN